MIVRYRTQRDEIWRWYWMQWRASLWRKWLLYGAAAFCLTMVTYNNGRWPQVFLIALFPPPFAKLEQAQAQQAKIEAQQAKIARQKEIDKAVATGEVPVSIFPAKPR